MVKKIKKYAKFVVCMALIAGLVAPSYAALSASDGSAFVTKAEFDSALADFNARLTTFEAGINSKIDSQVTSYLDRNGIWNGAEQQIEGMDIVGYASGGVMTLPRFWMANMVGKMTYVKGQEIYFRNAGGPDTPVDAPLWGTTVDFSQGQVLRFAPCSAQRCITPKVQGDKDVVIKNISKSGLMRLTFWYSAMGGAGFTVTSAPKSRTTLFRDDELMMDSTTNGINQFPLTKLYRALRSDPASSAKLSNYTWPVNVAGFGTAYMAFLGEKSRTNNTFVLERTAPGWTNRAVAYQGGAMWYLNDQELYFDPMIDWSGVPAQLPINWGLGADAGNWFQLEDMNLDIGNLLQTGSAFSVPFNCPPKQKTWYTFVSKGDEVSLKFTELYNGRLGSNSTPYWGWVTNFEEWIPQASERAPATMGRFLGLQVVDAAVY